MPFETASAAKALIKATNAVSASGIGRGRIHVVLPFGCVRLRASEGSPQKARDQHEPNRFDRLGEERERVDRLGFGVHDGHASRDDERIACDQAGEERSRSGEPALRRGPRAEDGKQGQEDRGDGEAEPGSRAPVEVVLHQCAVDPGTDCAGENDDARSQFREAQVPITVRCTSWLRGVQTRL